MRIPNVPGAKHTIIARDALSRKHKKCLLKSEEIISFSGEAWGSLSGRAGSEVL